MNKKLTGLVTSLFVFLLLANTVIAQDEADTTTGWKTSLITDLTLTQTAYSDSWVGGEAGSMSWVGNLNGKAERQFSPSFNLRSTLKLSFGQTVSQDSLGDWSKPHKSTDLIDWENVGTITKGWPVDPYAAFRLESQFLDASVPAINRYFSPIRLTESIGLQYKFHEEDKELITTRAGFALRQTLETYVTDSIALTTSDTTISDGGLESVTDATLLLSDKMAYIGKLTLFKALFSDTKEDPDPVRADYWKAVDVNWENIVAAQLSKIFAVTLYFQLQYDKEISKKARIKEAIGLGFVFKLV